MFAGVSFVCVSGYVEDGEAAGSGVVVCEDDSAGFKFIVHVACECMACCSEAVGGVVFECAE